MNWWINKYKHKVRLTFIDFVESLYTLKLDEKKKIKAKRYKELIESIFSKIVLIMLKIKFSAFEKKRIYAHV